MEKLNMLKPANHISSPLPYRIPDYVGKKCNFAAFSRNGKSRKDRAGFVCVGCCLF